ncbi:MULTISPECIES: hypothetical protein [Pseudobutyrivibrio]|uniref:Uncharacterized protein n=1 Tax=Pseudobutyrivibrio xylanivorans TaxID=185007 RepID=A0A1G5S1N5_PSEXY|nr:MULTISPECIES: hypothetical protein [Pseudobutyrivibrio]MDC7280073.1 hypothetical protein [Butyrivibrio fibrisolvens]SCZ80274.1 hypothetical protein SAMN02910350_02207 [Pseudobutyrivibrio xylanivorans]
MLSKKSFEEVIEAMNDAEKEALYRALLKYKAKKDVYNLLQNRLPAMIEGAEEELLLSFCEKIADIYAYSNHGEEDPSYWISLEDLIRCHCDELFAACNAA